MLGFGKKKKKKEEGKDPIADPAPEKKTKKQEKKSAEDLDSNEKKPLLKIKTFITKKRIIILCLVLTAIAASSFLVYSMYLKKGSSGPPVYKIIELNHVNLPEEMLKFSFEHFPDLYASLIIFNREVILIDKELAWIEGVAQKYPEQLKITAAEQKIWEKGKNTLVKDFTKLEKPVKEAYVLFQVNEIQGLVMVEEKRKELADTARNSLKTAQELTQKLKSREPELPDSFFQGILYKFKKKFP
jgi:hypothetical protein